jgi:hypothetical protein
MTTYTADTFQLDDLGEWQGIHNPSIRWNGWACPLFTLDTCREIAFHINELCSEEEIIVTESQVFDTYTDGDDKETHELHPIEINGINYYPLGSHGWVWDSVNS